MFNTTLIAKAPSVIKTYGKMSPQKLEVSTDTRDLSGNEFFIALTGPNFNAFDFIEEALGKGCPYMAFNNTPENEKRIKPLVTKFKKTVFVSVQDTLLFLQEISNLHIKAWREDKRLIGITGSNGKTTCKEMLFSLLDRLTKSTCPTKKRVYASEKNLNNHIGVPLSLLKVEDKHDIAIIEMGSNHPGEIEILCNIALPNAGIITSIGQSHLEFFKTEDGIFQEKKSLYDAVMKNSDGNGLFVINADDKYLARLPVALNVYKFGQNQPDMTIKYTEKGFILTYDNSDYSIENQRIIGQHNFCNLAYATIMALSLFPRKMSEIILAASSYIPPANNRAVWLERDNRKFFMDAYNANPSSMRAALESFVEYIKKSEYGLEDCLFVLGDMNELGQQTETLHQEIGQLLAKLGAINVVFIGQYREFYKAGFQNRCSVFPSKTEFKAEWVSAQKRFKIYFLKSSRALQLESLADITY